MALKIYPNYQRGAGYAWIEIGAALPKDLTMTIFAPNRVNKSFLGARGWQGSPHELKPVNLEGTSLGSRILVGPEIVDSILEDELIELRIPLVGYSEQTTWPDNILPSGIPRVTMEDDPPLATVARPVVDEVKSDPPRPAPALLSDPPPSRPSDPIQTPRLPLLQRYSFAAWVVVGFAIGCGAGLWYMSFTPGRSSAEMDNVAADVADAQRLLPGTVEQAEQIYQIGMRLRNSGPARELGLQALHRAAELNYVPALLWFGRTADPTLQDWRGIRLKPDASLALDAYNKAERANSAEARQLKSALCRHLESDATLAGSSREAVSNGCA